MRNTKKHPEWDKLSAFIKQNKDLKIGIVSARFNAELTEEMRLGAMEAFSTLGADLNNIIEVKVPGAFELPFAARRLIEKHKVNAVICFGAVIKGDTPHFDYVCAETARGIQLISLTTNVPVIFGVLTTNTLEQAQLRANRSQDNKGAESALAAVEMLTL